MNPYLFDWRKMNHRKRVLLLRKLLDRREKDDNQKKLRNVELDIIIEDIAFSLKRPLWCYDRDGNLIRRFKNCKDFNLYIGPVGRTMCV